MKKISWIFMVVFVGLIGVQCTGEKEGLPSRTGRIAINDSSEVRIRTYANGLIKDSGMFVNDTLQGVAIYRDSNNFVYRFFYIDGVENGMQTSAYPSGARYGVGQILKDTQVGEWYFYHPDGSIKSYEFFNDFGERVFMRKYDLTGKVVLNEGKGFFMMDEDTCYKGHQATQFKFASPPNCEVELLFGDTGKHDLYYLRVENKIAYYLKDGKVGESVVRSYLWRCKDTLRNEFQESEIKCRFLLVEKDDG